MDQALALNELRRAAARAGVPAALSVFAFILAFLQRPGELAFDSRLELTANAALFVDRVRDVWSPSVDLGHVQSAQLVGYLFPMGPWYAAWDATGLPMWIGQRLWLGALLALAAWGVVRLFDDLGGAGRRIGAAFAGAVYITAPYVGTFVSARSVVLLAYAALPWLLVAVHRGLAAPTGWRWPAVAALLIAVAGGGVNVTIVVWVVLAALALVAYEVAVLGRQRGAAPAFLWRAALCASFASAWWAVPVLFQGTEAGDFLRFTEGPETIWATTSLSESIRGLGYWLLYLAVGAQPVRSIADTYLFAPVLIVATFLVPLLAIGGFRWTRQWTYGPFFALLAVAALLVMSAGFPEGAPMRTLLSSIYEEVEWLRFLRTTYKAAPLLALAVACLGGAALAFAAERMRRPLALVALILPLLVGLPLVTGKLLEPEEAYGEIPEYWKQAVLDADRLAPPGKRTLVLPGALFGWYRWGNTVYAVAPAISKRAVLVRGVERYAAPRASQMQAEVDDLIQQDRLVPRQLEPLLGLLGVGQVLVHSDYRPVPSGALDQASLAELLEREPGFALGEEDYGGVRSYAPPPGRSGPAREAADVRRFSASASGPGIVRLHGRSGAVVLDGDAEGVVGLAAAGRLDVRRALFYAGDLDRAQLAEGVRRGATLVFTDSHRRRVLESNQLRANRGPTLGARDALPPEWPAYDLFPDRGSGAQTVARYSNLDYLRAPLARGRALYPEHRPYAALDGRTETSWLASDSARPGEQERWIELGFSRPRRLGFIRVLPHRDRLGLTDEVALSVNGGRERRYALGGGSNRLRIGADEVRRLRLRVLGTDGPFGGPGGIAELGIPGLEVGESLRLPTELSRLAGGLDLARNPMLVLLRRTTADFPFRAGRAVGEAQAGDPLDMVDAEPGLVRDVTLPVGRSFDLGGWASIDPGAPDRLIDGLAGLRQGWRFDSSGRFEGVPGNRASSAFDADPATAWIADAPPGALPWISWRAPAQQTIRSLRLSPGPPETKFPRRVRVAAPGGLSITRTVPASGRVALPVPLRARGLRITVLSSYPPRKRRGLRATAVAEIAASGLRPPRPRRHGSLAGRCGDIVVRAGGRTARARLSGTVEELDAGRPLAIRPCGRSLALPRGTSRLEAPPGAVARPDHLVLFAPAPVPSRAPAPGRVLSPGAEPRGGQRDDVRLAVEEPAWLVLAESYSTRWKAWCRDASGRERELGRPTPIDGYANGWAVDERCAGARFAFGPQRLADVSHAISAVAGLILLLLALVAPGERSRSLRPGPAIVPSADRLSRLGAKGALAAGVAAGAAGSLLFALRAGAVLAPLAFALALLGVNVRRLIALATVALLATLFLYLADPPQQLFGFSPTYAQDHIAAHWAAVLCVACLAAAALLAAHRARAAREP